MENNIEDKRSEISNKTKTIRICPYCNSQYEVKPGLSNIKNLFRKPSWNEWFILVIIIIVLIGAYFYYQDTKTCRETLNNLDKVCERYRAAMINNSIPGFNIKQQVDNLSGNIYEVDKKINLIPLIPNGS